MTGIGPEKEERTQCTKLLIQTTLGFTCKRGLWGCIFVDPFEQLLH